jgi:hypothetical protein
MANRDQSRVEALLIEIKKKTDKVPESVINGSYNKAVEFKDAVRMGVSLLNSQRPSMRRLEECASKLRSFDGATTTK